MGEAKGKLVAKSCLTTIKVGEHKGEDMYVMKMHHGTTIDADSLIRRASKCGIPEAALIGACVALKEAIMAATLNGHTVEIPGIGFIRAELRAKAQTDPNMVSMDDIIRRKFAFIPSKEMKEGLNTADLEIACYDKNGKVVRKSAKEVKK